MILNQLRQFLNSLREENKGYIKWRIRINTGLLTSSPICLTGSTLA
jgi:hypothetical protein